MRCPYCGGDGTQVKDSRPSEDGASIRRRRVCVVCGGRFTTFERVQLRELVVVKRNNRREPFDREKLQRSVEIACRKRPVGEERIERMVSGIVRQLEAGGESEVAAEAIGNLVMEALKTVDDVAYVRFASVYRNFREARDFEAFVGELARTVGLDRPRAGEGDQPELPGAAPRSPPLDLRRSAAAREGEPAAERTAAPSATGAGDDGETGAATPEEDGAARRGAGRATGPSSTAAPGAYDDSVAGEDDVGGPRRAGGDASAFGEQMPLLEERPDDNAARGEADGDAVAGRRPPPRGRRGAGRGRTRSNGRAAGGADPTDDTDT